jgi:hypothetical protein
MVSITPVKNTIAIPSPNNLIVLAAATSNQIPQTSSASSSTTKITRSDTLPLSNPIQDSSPTFVDYSTIGFTQSQSTTVSLSQPNAPNEEPIVLTDEERPFTIQLSQSTINTMELPTSIPTFIQPLHHH